MARLTRVYQKVFASNASNNGVFGSFQAGNPQTSNDVATLQSLSAFENGWDDAIEQGDKLPPLEEFQGIQYGISYQQAYILQEGIAEWNSSTPYYKGSLVKTISGTSFKIFSSLEDNNVGNITTNTTYWKLAYDSDIGYADTNFSNLLSPAKNIANWSSNVSNCITEIPQDINLELSSGTLKLKAGSKVYAPNGSGVFKDITLSSDVTIPLTGVTGQRMVFITVNTALTSAAAIVGVNGVNVFSGSSAPTVTVQTAYWYDTTNNVIKRTQDTGSTWAPISGVYFCLPICLATASSGTITSIDQIFNGFGFMGSSAFVLPGVKGLIPNGRNADGTLKNIQVSVSSVRTAQVNQYTGSIRLSQNSIQAGTSNIRLDETENLVYDGSTQLNVLIVGPLTQSSGTITSFNPKSTFHAVDYSDKNKIISWCMPDYNSILSNVGNGYTAPSDGIFWFSVGNNNSYRSVGITPAGSGIEINFDAVVNSYGAAGGYQIYLSKGDKVQIGSSETTLPHSYFIPLKGV